MGKSRGDFTDVLVRKKILSPDQLEEARSIATAQGVKLQDALAKLGYATATDCAQAMDEASGLPFVDLSTMEIPKAVVELVPESVARENLVMPLGLEGNAMRIALADPDN